jgi:homoserine O-acetyltransferase/O-succinyltransferase
MNPASSDQATYPAPRPGDWTIRDFHFHTGEVLPELNLHYLTIGDASGEPVLVLHGSNATAESMVTRAFAGELFGPGQPLDAGRYFVVIPDAIGLGKSSKPSDGLRTRFPRYNYGDMVDAQHRLVSEHLGIAHLRLVIGTSMGGMHCWVWGVRYPHFMDALVPLGCQPAAVSGRNQIMRRLAIEMIRRDPDYRDGDYARQPRALKLAEAVLKLGFNGGELALLARAPTRAAADALVDEELAQPPKLDANDFIWRFAASRDYDPSPDLERIEAAVLAINSADDERNPPHSGILERALSRLKNGRLHLVPATAGTNGHSTTANAQLYREELREFLRTVPRRAWAARRDEAALSRADRSR